MNVTLSFGCSERTNKRNSITGKPLQALVLLSICSIVLGSCGTNTTRVALDCVPLVDGTLRCEGSLAATKINALLIDLIKSITAGVAAGRVLALFVHLVSVFRRNQSIRAIRTFLQKAYKDTSFAKAEAIVDSYTPEMRAKLGDKYTTESWRYTNFMRMLRNFRQITSIYATNLKPHQYSDLMIWLQDTEHVIETLTQRHTRPLPHLIYEGFWDHLEKMRWLKLQSTLGSS